MRNGPDAHGESRRFTQQWTTTFFVIAAGFIALGTWPYIKDRIPTATAQTTTSRSCEAWGAQYAVIPWDKFPRDTLRVGPGEEWVIRLHPSQPSGLVILDPRLRSWTRPTAMAHMLFSDGLEITDTPEKQVKRGKRNSFRAWGEGCLLVQVSG